MYGGIVLEVYASTPPPGVGRHHRERLLSTSNSTRRSVARQADGKRPDRWRRSQDVAARAHALDGLDTNGSHPAAELERILREYACECYAVGRGESMYYLVEDLPRLAREAAGEILELKALRSDSSPLPRLPRFEPVALKNQVLKKSRLSNQVLLPGRKVAAAKGTAKNIVAALPFIAVLAVIGLTIGLTFREFVTGG